MPGPPRVLSQVDAPGLLALTEMRVLRQLKCALVPGVLWPGDDTTRGQMATFLYRAENRTESDSPSSEWERAEGESDRGRYVEFRASGDLTETDWRPKGLALMWCFMLLVGVVGPSGGLSRLGFGRVRGVARRAGRGLGRWRCASAGRRAANGSARYVMVLGSCPVSGR